MSQPASGAEARRAQSAGGPVVSVVTTTFNRASLLPRAWASLRDQPCEFEWIVVDDASRDDTASVVAGFDDPRIQYVRHPVDRGGPAAGRNDGARAARGRYIVFLDDDDELFPGALPRMVDALEDAPPEVGCAMFQCVFPDGSRWNERITHGAIYHETDVVCGRGLGMEKILVYRREVFEEFQLAEDLLFVEGAFVYALSTKYGLLMVDEPGRVYHDTGERNSNAAGMRRISPLIARGYERIVNNHREVLRGCPASRRYYLTKALYRYGVAGQTRESWRVLRLVLGERDLRSGLVAIALFLVGAVGLAPALERVRVPLGTRGKTRVQTA
jgi:glycosyltransferase involved in cell wall biosynthesis